MPKSVYIGLTKGVNAPDPTYPNEAFKISHSRKAMEQEYEALIKNKTW